MAAGEIFAALLVQDGRAAAEILIPADALPVEVYAAEELQSHIKLVSKADLPILRHPSGKVRSVIRIGRAANSERATLPLNGGKVVISEKEICITGDDDPDDPMNFTKKCGTLFAVYDFLEKKLGIRWLWPGELGTFTPECPTIDLAGEKWECRPPLAAARWRFRRKRSGWYSNINGEKFYDDGYVWLRRHRFNMVESLEYGHAFIDYFRKFGKSNPGLFNLLPDGSRRPDPLHHGGAHDLVSMCVSNPDLIKQIIADWQQGTMPLINANENDTAGKCLCENCLALDHNSDVDRVARAGKRWFANDPAWFVELGSLSERYAAFYRKLLEEAGKVKKDSEIIALIYSNYHEPPRYTKLDKQIIMQFCPPIMYPWTPRKVAGFKQFWQGWADTGASMMLRPNFTLDGHNMPLLYHREFAECFDFARDRGIRYIDYDSLRGTWGANGITHYVIAAKNGGGMFKNVTELENEYLAAFGKAAPAMRELMELMIKVTAKGNNILDDAVGSSEGSAYYDKFFLVADQIFLKQDMDAALQILDRAARLAQGDPLVLARVNFVRAGYEDACLTLKVQRSYRKYLAEGDPQEIAAALAELERFRQKNEHLIYADIGSLRNMEEGYWPMHLAMLGNDSMELKSWDFRFDIENKGVSEKWFSPEFNGKWTAVSVDKHIQMQPVYKQMRENGGPIRPIGWYRCQFNTASVNPRQPIKLTFGAVDGDADIYLNGKLIHQRQYPHNGDTESWQKPFDVNVSGLLKEGINTLVVRVNKREPYYGASGIWRGVFISSGKMKEQQNSAGWKVNIQKGTFSVDETAYPLTLVCRKAGDDKRAYNGVWGRVFKSFPVESGKIYEVRISYRQSGKAKLSAWILSENASDSGKANLYLDSLVNGDDSRTLIGRVVPEGNACNVYLNLIGGVGKLEIFSFEIYPVTTFSDEVTAPEKWKSDVRQGKFSVNARNYPIIITSLAPAADRKIYNGVWGRVYGTFQLIPNRRYKVEIICRQSGNAQFSAWISGENGDILLQLTADGGSGKKKLSGTFTTSGKNHIMYLNLLNGVGSVAVESIKYSVK